MDIAMHGVSMVTVTRRTVGWTHGNKFYVTTLLIHSADGTQEIKLFSDTGHVPFVGLSVTSEDLFVPSAAKPTTAMREPF